VVVVEGPNDVEFLRRISLLLHASDESTPNLAAMEQSGELIFVPFGGGKVCDWAFRLAPLRKPEFHIYDHEVPPETEYRLQAAEAVNSRARCKAVVTHKRSLENYLHPRAVRDAGEIEIEFDDFDCVADLTAKRLYQIGINETPWELLSKRARSRLAYRAKRWLNTTVAGLMTAKLLRERDPRGEITSWLNAISQLANS